jgi:pilus assembly protein CpaE
MSRAIIAEPEGIVAERLRTAAASAHLEIVSVPSLEAALDEIEASQPEVLVIGPSLVGDTAFELAGRLSEAGVTFSVLVASQVDALFLRRAMRAGCIDAVGIEEPIEDIATAIARGGTTGARARADLIAPEEMADLAKTITVFSTKGGVGKTVLATNLAVALAKATNKSVAIVDLDLEFGDVGIMLGIKPEHTIYDAVQAFDRLDTEMLAGFMQEHSSGIHTLLAPLRPEDAEAISAARVGQVIDLVRATFDYVVIDTSPSFSEAVLAALDRSDEVYVVTMMDVASIKNTRISLQKLRQLGYSNGRLRLVLNRSDSKVLLETTEVEKAIGGEISAHIPSDRVVPRSVNKGVPVVIDMPRSNVARSIFGIAKGAAVPVEREADNVA